MTITTTKTIVIIAEKADETTNFCLFISISFDDTPTGRGRDYEAHGTDEKS